MSLKVQFVEKTLKAANTSLYYLLGYRIFAAMKFESVRNNFSADWISVQPLHTATFFPFFVWSCVYTINSKQFSENIIYIHCKCLQGFTGTMRGFSAISVGKIL